MKNTKALNIILWIAQIILAGMSVVLPKELIILM